MTVSRVDAARSAGACNSAQIPHIVLQLSSSSRGVASETLERHRALKYLCAAPLVFGQREDERWNDAADLLQKCDVKYRLLNAEKYFS